MVYARMDRTGDIYRIRRTQLTFAESAGLNTLLDRFVSPVVVATLSQVRVTTVDGETTLRIEYENGDDNTTSGRTCRKSTLPSVPTMLASCTG